MHAVCDDVSQEPTYLWEHFREMFSRPVKWPAFIMNEHICLLPFTHTNRKKKSALDRKLCPHGFRSINSKCRFVSLWQKPTNYREHGGAIRGQDAFHIFMRNRISTWLAMQATNRGSKLMTQLVCSTQRDESSCDWDRASEPDVSLVSGYDSVVPVGSSHSKEIYRKPNGALSSAFS